MLTANNLEDLPGESEKHERWGGGGWGADKSFFGERYVRSGLSKLRNTKQDR